MNTQPFNSRLASRHVTYQLCMRAPSASSYTAHRCQHQHCLRADNTVYTYIRQHGDVSCEHPLLLLGFYEGFSPQSSSSSSIHIFQTHRTHSTHIYILHIVDHEILVHPKSQEMQSPLNYWSVGGIWQSTGRRGEGGVESNAIPGHRHHHPLQPLSPSTPTQRRVNYKKNCFMCVVCRYHRVRWHLWYQHCRCVRTPLL